jgi:hypothetical protein
MVSVLDTTLEERSTVYGMTMEAIRTSTILLRDCFIHEQESKTIKRKFIGQHENTDTFSGEFIKQGKI